VAHSGSDADAYVTHTVEPRRVARAGRRLGTALVGAAGPALITAALVALTRGSTGSATSWVSDAMATPLLGGEGAAWAFHVAAITGLAGVWLVGFALVVEGYFGLE